MIERRRRQCQHCQELFDPDYRNVRRQSFCSREACRQASKAHSQKQWLAKPANKDYFRGSQNVQRVQQWRKEHPGYWKKPPPEPDRTLQEVCLAQAAESQEFKSSLVPPPLQDLFLSQDPLLVGLISHLIDSTLQENIESATRRLLAKGRDILDMKFGMNRKEKDEHQKADHLSRAPAAHSRTVQLDRPASGP